MRQVDCTTIVDVVDEDAAKLSAGRTTVLLSSIVQSKSLSSKMLLLYHQLIFYLLVIAQSVILSDTYRVRQLLFDGTRDDGQADSTEES